VSGDDAGAGQEPPVGHGPATRSAQADAGRAGRHDHRVRRSLGHGSGPSPAAGQAVHAVGNLRRAARGKVEAQTTGFQLLGRGGGPSEVRFAGVWWRCQSQCRGSRRWWMAFIGQ